MPRTPLSIFRAHRPCLVAWAALLAATALLHAAPEAQPETPERALIPVSYVYVRWQGATDFKRISEYFTGREDTGGNLIVRTDPAIRAGLYFRVGMPFGFQLPEHAKAVLEYVCDDAHAVSKHTFDLPAMPGGPFAEILLGVTGKNWPDRKRKLVAWRITLTGENDTVIACRQSFLWSMREPDGKPLAPPAASPPAPATPVSPPQPEKP
ncbi:MAG: hypothetical protein LBV54_05275 [Puniceicoccales bacterium]|nr:hypothetical protein [Puniceicoccales bacterium]